MKQYFRIMFCVLALPISMSAGAQNVDENNFRNRAYCVEKIINGRVFSTFGEGPCPPGSRRSSDVNSRQLEATEGAVNALGSAQQALVNWGAARFAEKHRESVQILSKYFFVDPGETQSEAYLAMRVDLPFRGRLAAGEVGDVIIRSFDGIYSDCISMKNDFSKEMMGWVHEIKSHNFACRLESESDGYTPLYINYKKIKKSDNIPDFFVYPQYLKEKGGLYSLCIKDMGVMFGCRKDIPSGEIERGRLFVGEIGTERPRLIFMGFKNNVLNFKGYHRNKPDSDSGEQLQLDPALSRELSFDGLVLELLDFNENNVTLRVK